MATLKNTIITDVGHLQLPVGTTAQRSGSPVNGETRFNSQFKIVEQYVDGVWKYLPPIIENGLVLYLDAAEPASYPGTGTTWNDLSNNQNNGTLVNGPTFDSANAGSLNFDGVDDYVTVSHNSNINLVDTVSLEAWIKYTATSNTVLIEKSNNNTHYQFQVFNNTQGSGISGELVFMLQSNSNNWVVSGIATNDGNWHHVVGTYNRSMSTAKIYVDGVLRNSNPSISNGPTSNTQPLLIGSRSGAAGFGGSIAGVKIYNRAISAEEVQQNFNALRGRYGV